MRAHEFEPVSEKINHDITEKNWHAETTINLPKVGELILRGRNLSHIHPPQFTVEVFTPENKSIGYFRFLVLDWEKPKTGWFAPKPKKDPYVIGGNISVWDEYQKKGIARAVYQWVKSLGNDIRPSTTQTAAGKSMWRSFEKNPLDEAKTTREDFEGMTIEMVKNGHILVINALDDWGNNVLGSVAFNIGDDNDLDPQDLKVDERYQGQGIARIMYDYAKSKGYEIHRSYDQTDAGAGFWNKHRGEDVRVWEAFNRPYKGKWEKSEYSGSVDVLTKLPDGTNLSIMFNDEGDGEYQVQFYRNNSQSVTGEGDAQRIFATVLAAIQQFIKKYKPWRLTFSASKDPDEAQNTESRAKLYNRMVQRYARAWGYEDYAEDHGDQITYELTQLKQGVAEAFDKPHKTKLNELFTSYGGYELHHNPNYTDRGYIYSFETKDERDGEIIIKPKHLRHGVDSVVFVEFNIDGSTDTSGKGDAIMIFSTVLKAVNGFAREYKPQLIVFETEDPEKLKLYWRLVKYFAGYKPVDWTKDKVLNRQIEPELSGFANEAIVLQRQDNADSIKPHAPAKGLYVIYGRGKYAGQVWHRFDLDASVTTVGNYNRDRQAEKFADEWVEKNEKRLGNWNMNYQYDWNLAKDPSGLDFGPAPDGQYSLVSQQDIEFMVWYISQRQNLDKQGVAENRFVNFMNKSLSTKVDKPPEDPLAHAPDFYKNAPVANARIRPAFLKALKFGLSVLAKLDAETKQELLERGEHAICVYIDSVAERTGATGFREEDVYECQDDLANIFHDPTMHSWVDVLQQDINENFADGRNPQDKGDSKRYRVPTKSSVSNLRKFAKSHSGRAAQLANWAANMKAGRAKKK